MEINFFSKILFRLTSELQEKLFLTIGKIFTEKLSKLFSTCSGKNWRNSFFKKFLFFMHIRTSSETFLTFGNFSLQICQNCILRVQTNSLMEKISVKISYPFFIGLWLKFFLTYAKIRTEKVPEPIFTCSENILKKQFFPKFFFVFGTN